MPDFHIINHGSIFQFFALSDDAQEFAEEAFADAMTFGGAYVVEHRYAADIAADLIGRGFIIE